MLLFIYLLSTYFIKHLLSTRPFTRHWGDELKPVLFFSAKDLTFKDSFIPSPSQVLKKGRNVLKKLLQNTKRFLNLLLNYVVLSQSLKKS